LGIVGVLVICGGVHLRKTEDGFGTVTAKAGRDVGEHIYIAF